MLSVDQMHVIQPRSGENRFVWVVAGRSPATTHTKLSPCTGRKRRRPAKVRTRPRPRHDRILSVNQPNSTGGVKSGT